AEKILAPQSQAVHDRELPGLLISFSEDTSLLRRIASPGKKSFSGLLQQGDKFSLTTLRAIPDRKGARVVMLRIPVSLEFLATGAPDLGAIQLNLLERYTFGSGKERVFYSSGDVQYRFASCIVAKNRSLQEAVFWLDKAVNPVSSVNSVFVGLAGKVEMARP